MSHVYDVISLFIRLFRQTSWGYFLKKLMLRRWGIEAQEIGIMKRIDYGGFELLYQFVSSSQVLVFGQTVSENDERVFFFHIVKATLHRCLKIIFFVVIKIILSCPVLAPLVHYSLKFFLFC